MFLDSACTCLRTIYWSQVFSGEWRCSWSSMLQLHLSDQQFHCLLKCVLYIHIYMPVSLADPKDLSKFGNPLYPLQWCHNEADDVSNHQPHDCLLKRLFRRRSKETSKLWLVNSPQKGPVKQKMLPIDDVIMLKGNMICVEKSQVTGEFPTQKPVMRNFDVSFDLCLNKRPLTKWVAAKKIPPLSLKYKHGCLTSSWWHHQMETFSALLGHLCREFTGHRWIPLTKASDKELWCFLWSVPE